MLRYNFAQAARMHRLLQGGNYCTVCIAAKTFKAPNAFTRRWRQGPRGGYHCQIIVS